MDSPVVTFTQEELVLDFQNLKKIVPTLPVSCHSRQGLKIVEHFQPHFWETESPSGDSIAKNWKNTELMQKANERTAKHYKVIYKSEIRRNLAFFSKACLPTMYRPILTKAIVTKYNRKDVLDPCVGWGGRLIGSACIPGVSFTGIEPYSKTFEGLSNIVKYCKFSNVKLINEGAEVALLGLPSESFDLILTSPPYFNLEVYGHEDSQSIVKFPTWDEWCEKFLVVVIRECLRCLKPGGLSAWSVKNMGKNKLQDKVFEIHKRFGYTLLGTEGMTATPRNTGKVAKITEETFIFHKV